METSFKEELKEICLDWERLRKIFNLCLVVSMILTLIIGKTLIESTASDVTHVEFRRSFVFRAMIYAIIINGLYMIGPLFEVYLKILEIKQTKKIRRFLFVFGTIGCMFITHIVTIKRAFIEFH